MSDTPDNPEKIALEISQANSPVKFSAPQSTTAEELVDLDKDDFPPEPDAPQPGVDAPPTKASEAPTPPQTEKERQGGRPPLPPTGDPKIDARRARDRERKRKDGGFRPAPDFTDVKHRTGETLPGAAKPEQAPTSVSSNPAPLPPDYKALSEMCFGLATGVAVSAIGPEWKCQDDAERDTVTVPLAAWMQSKNLPDLPIGAVLLLSIGLYGAKRMHVPTTRQKVLGFWGWAKGKLFRKRPTVIVQTGA